MGPKMRTEERFDQRLEVAQNAGACDGGPEGVRPKAE